ncbi:MAG: hypothetical protein MUD15_01900 [Desulfobacterota bacterium]|jgi:hypothetical protein|nr:hypothetical protein [Thermodesulfobacteriota bacterium]
MHDLLSAVSTNRILERILPLLPGGTYLVGGCIRDLLLGIEPFDFDLVTFDAPLDLGRRIAGVLGGNAFSLDRERGVERIAIDGGRYTIDISAARGADIGADLLERDITINAMACLPAEGACIDPLQGLADLRAGRIRLIGERNLLDDPLRGLRCLRFAVQLGFSVEAPTMSLVRRHAAALEGVASERIKHEFLQALAGPQSSMFFMLLAQAGLDRVLFGDAPRTLALEIVRRADSRLDEREELLPGVGDHFSQELEHGLTRAAAFRLAAFLHGCTDPRQAGRILRKRFALSGKACRTIMGTMAGAGSMPGLAGNTGPSGSGMYRVLSEHEGCIPEMLLLAMAAPGGDEKGNAGAMERACSEIWGFFLGRYRSCRENPLLTGHDIMKTLKIPMGPKVGALLRQVEQAQADGLIGSPQEALTFLRERTRS